MLPNQEPGRVLSAAPVATTAAAEEKHAATDVLRMFGLGPCGPLCDGRLTAVRSSCRPGEFDISVQCSSCGDARHFVRTVNGAHLSDSAQPEKDLLAAFRNPPLDQLGPKDLCHWSEDEGRHVIIRAAKPEDELHRSAATLQAEDSKEANAPPDSTDDGQPKDRSFNASA